MSMQAGVCFCLLLLHGDKFLPRAVGAEQANNATVLVTPMHYNWLKFQVNWLLGKLIVPAVAV